MKRPLAPSSKQNQKHSARESEDTAQMKAKYVGNIFNNRFGPWAVIAGGSDGIGSVFAEELASRGLNLALIAQD